MGVGEWLSSSEALPGAPGVRRVRVPLEQWRSVALDVAGASGRLAALWASGDALGGSAVHAVFLVERAALVVSSSWTDSAYPGLEDLFPAAARMQRATADLSGVYSTGADVRPWLRMGAR